jgi:hypothetical protein
MAPTWKDCDLSFDEAAERIVQAHRHDGEVRDLPIPDLRSWGIVPLGGRFALAPLAQHHPPFVLRSAAFANLAARLGGPVEFLRRLPAPLQLANLGYLLISSDQPVTSTLRLRGDEVTALVSERYAQLDSEQLLASVRDALVRHGALEEVRVRSTATGLIDVVRLVFPSESVAIKVGDVSAVGIDISSSSFGRSAVHVRGITYRIYCSNGARSAERHGAFSFRHVGEPQRLRDGIAEAIPSALVAARGTMDRWKAAVYTMVEQVAASLDQLRELSVSERSRFEAALKEGAGTSELPGRIPLYDFLNGLTLTAHAATPGRRLELESIAGEFLHRELGGAS